MKFDPESSLARLRKVALGSAILFSLGGAILGLPYFLGVVGGGTVALVNFDALERLVRRLTAERPGPLSFIGVFGLLFRYILLCLVLFVIISVWHANVVALAVGFSAPVVAVFVECGLYAYRELTEER